MINFYSLSDHLHQICLRDLSIYYSFKMPIAYRISGQGLRTRKNLRKVDLDIITAGHTYMIMHKRNFDANLKRLFKSTIYNLAEDYTKKRMKIEQEEKNQPIYLGELNNVGKFGNPR